MDNEVIDESLVIDSLMMSHWEQASDYLKTLGTKEIQHQIEWVYDNEPEQLLGFSKWVARRFENVKEELDSFKKAQENKYSSLEKVFEKILESIGNANKPFFKLITDKLVPILGEVSKIQQDYIKHKLLEVLKTYYSTPTQDNLKIVENFYTNPLGQFENIGNFLDVNFNGEENEFFQSMLDSEDEFMDLMCLLDYYIVNFNDPEKDYVKNLFINHFKSENFNPDFFEEISKIKFERFSLLNFLIKA